ncbi:DNA repair protein rad51 like protein 4 [Plakobranchus ocellatus]|uniref:DNA repair protein rad51 like protein 4 n=1 Tax=Plakobranchus ocellatus TaxID=259542 RepID=A0AAV3YVQ8_9GAST|nr:DNA repair protein rad51 like protein 4 [Plakobranchus ocellatus]
MALKVGMCTAMNAEMFTKLETAGIASAVDFISRDPEVLSRELNVAYKDVCSIRRVLLAELCAHPVSALKLYEDALSSLTILSTGCSVLDQLLDGGLYTGELTELAGDTATGKTRICHWCAAAAVKNDLSSALYIDMGGSFDIPTILDAMAEVAGDQAAVQSRLRRIKCLQVFDVFQLFALLEKVMADSSKEELPSEWGNLKLVIVENLPLFIYPIMGANAPYNQGILSRLGLKLKQLAGSLSVAVLVTNSLVSMYGQGRTDQQRKAALGRVWSHVPHNRIILNRVGSDSAGFPRPTEVEATLVKSSHQQTPFTATLNLADRDAST